MMSLVRARQVGLYVEPQQSATNPWLGTSSAPLHLELQTWSLCACEQVSIA